MVNTAQAAPSHQERVPNSHDTRLTHALSTESDILIRIGLKKDPVDIQCRLKFRNSPPQSAVFIHLPLGSMASPRPD